MTCIIFLHMAPPPPRMFQLFLTPLTLDVVIWDVLSNLFVCAWNTYTAFPRLPLQLLTTIRYRFSGNDANLDTFFRCCVLYSSPHIEYEVWMMHSLVIFKQPLTLEATRLLGHLHFTRVYRMLLGKVYRSLLTEGTSVWRHVAEFTVQPISILTRPLQEQSWSALSYFPREDVCSDRVCGVVVITIFRVRG